MILKNLPLHLYTRSKLHCIDGSNFLLPHVGTSILFRVHFVVSMKKAFNVLHGLVHSCLDQ